MYISKLNLRNYRNFSKAKLLFNKGVNTVIGENGVGKTNLFRAVRLLLDDSMIGAAYHLDESDFTRNIDDWRGHWIVLTVEFKDISAEESIQALFLHSTGDAQAEVVEIATYNLIFRPNKEIRAKLAALSDGDIAGMRAIIDTITIDDYETIFTGRSDADFSEDDIYNEIVGDFENAIFSDEVDDPRIGTKTNNQFSIAKEISFTHIQALRDVISDFRNNRTNPLRSLLNNKTGSLDPAAFSVISSQVDNLNTAIEALDEVKSVEADIIKTIKGAAGETYSPSSMTIKSGLSNEADKLLQSLKLYIGEDQDGYEGGVNELSLGGANLIYLTLKLLEFKYQKPGISFANFLFIEEPEAHIHNHIQKTLFNNLAYKDTQIVYSTHSTQISEVSKVSSMNILAHTDTGCVAFQPAKGLPDKKLEHLERYLDAIRSNLLFARGVLLVEGDAEELLIPIMVKSVIGVSIDELGLSLVNVGSTGFENVANIFHDDRVRKYCAILTDLDKSTIDITPVEGEDEKLTAYRAVCERSQISGVARKVALDTYTSSNQWVAPFYAEHTFEVELLRSGNKDLVISSLPSVYKTKEKITAATTELNSTDLSVYSKRVLQIAKSVGKGWFAILLGSKVNDQTKIPQYILNALAFATPSLGTNVWVNIFDYRLGILLSNGTAQAVVSEFQAQLQLFKKGELDFDTIRISYSEKFADDQLNLLLGAY